MVSLCVDRATICLHPQLMLIRQSLTNSFYRQVHDRSHNNQHGHSEKLTYPFFSVLFRRNYAMLAAVFTAGLAFEVGFNNGVNKWWDNHNRGRQWKDIRAKYVEDGAEDEE
ncbi:hypothetical protein ED733_006363 [Metarhizium rileyi]|uniref:Complex III subunit 9 n=1 Tax=Metarhizium rileyi (strain RCEF 4871) TaxID=1649241 RepID=A0A5C6GKY0_METRR|nr:hypothetical protein ED733_006363 [Metarhizium rileyi]